MNGSEVWMGLGFGRDMSWTALFCRDCLEDIVHKRVIVDKTLLRRHV